MWKRMIEPGLIAFAIADALFSVAMAHLLVYGMGLRYLDWSGINSQPFDASNSVMAYTFLGGIIWPVAGFILALAISDLNRHLARNRRRKA